MVNLRSAVCPHHWLVLLLSAAALAGTSCARAEAAKPKPMATATVSVAADPADKPARPAKADTPVVGAQEQKQHAFYQGGVSAKPVEPATPARLALKYKIMLQDLDGDIRPVTEKYRFSTGERIRLLFESNVDGHLYVYHKGASGRGTQIFPDPRLEGGTNRIHKNTQYSVPPMTGASAGWWKFDGNVGTEELVFFLSPRPIPDLGAVRPSGQSGELDEKGWRTVESMSRAAAAGTRDVVYEGASAGAGQEAAARTQPGAATIAARELLIHTLRLQHGR